MLSCKPQHSTACLVYICLYFCAQGTINNTTNISTISAFTTTTKPLTKIHGFSYTDDNVDSKEFKMTISTAEMLRLNQLKTHASYSPSNTLYLLPVAKFDYCVNATDLAEGLDVKVNNARFQDSGASNTIHAYVHIRGNGAALDGSRDLLFSYDAGASNTGLNSANIKRLTIGVGNTLPTGTLNPANGGSFATTSDFDSSINLTSITKVVNNDPSYTQLDHYFAGTSSYSLTGTTATERSDTSYVYDKTTFGTDNCGTSNAGAVGVVIYVSIADILQVPAGDYDASIAFGFEANGGT